MHFYWVRGIIRLYHLSPSVGYMNTLGQAAGNVTETFRDFLVRIYENPFVSKIVLLLVAIVLSFVFMSLSKILAAYLKRKITQNFVTKGSKDIENVSALIGDIIFYTLTVLSLFMAFSIVGLKVGLIL